MKRFIHLLMIFNVFFLVTCCEGTGEEKIQWSSNPGLYALFDTSMGRIVCKLFQDEAPKTVANFTGLAQGTKEFTDTNTGKKVKRSFYDGLIFHRIIPKFMRFAVWILSNDLAITAFVPINIGQRAACSLDEPWP